MAAREGSATTIEAYVKSPMPRSTNSYAPSQASSGWAFGCFPAKMVSRKEKKCWSVMGKGSGEGEGCYEAVKRTFRAMARMWRIAIRELLKVDTSIGAV